MTSEEPVDSILEQAKSFPEVRNGLISVEQTAYNLAWNSLINPSEAPVSVIYNGIGPDLITVLRITNAANIHGVEFFPPTTEGLEHYVDNWKKVDNDPISLPPKRPQDISDYLGKDPTELELRRLFEERLEKRRSDGYWDTGTIRPWSIERCIAIELKRMGVNPDSVKIDTYGSVTRLEFEWESKKRKVVYHEGNILDAYDGKFDLPSVDCFYQKSIVGNQESWQKLILEGLPPYINEGGVILLGRPFGSKDEHQQLEKQDREILGEGFTSLQIPSQYERIMREKQFGKKNQMSYGWELYGFRKETPTK